jgi:hypothetical protein
MCVHPHAVRIIHARVDNPFSLFAQPLVRKRVNRYVVGDIELLFGSLRPFSAPPLSTYHHHLDLGAFLERSCNV